MRREARIRSCYGEASPFSQKVLFGLLLAQYLLASTSPAAQFLNISTRGLVARDDRPLIGGLILTGGNSKRVLLRGLGSSLAETGLTGVLSDPTLELRDQNGTLLFENDDWQDSQKSEIEETTLAPRNAAEAAIISYVFAAGNYTVLLRDAAGSAGIGLIEIYDLTPSIGSLGNISTRGLVETGDRVMIGGIIIGGGNQAAHVITRALGPSLRDSGIDDSLADPILELHSGSGGLVALNDNWKTDQRTLIEQTGVPPPHGLESAIVADLAPASYTAIVRGHGDAVGTSLVEFYQLSEPTPPSAVFSFENGLEGWTPKGTDLNNPPIQWSIESSPELASDGSRSAKFELWNYNDAGKIWLERAFTVQPNRSYHVAVQFAFGTQDWGDANHFNIIAGVRTSPAVTNKDLTFQDSTANGEHTNAGYKWLEKSYDFRLFSTDAGTLYIDIGIWGNWETYRAYYIDNVRITVTEN